MNLIPAKTPFLLKKLYPNCIWDIPSKEKVLYLTFDDGPTPDITDWTLDVLKQYNAKATFFCIGNNIEKHQEIFNRIDKEGHSIGNHTFNHPKGWKLKTEAYLKEVERTQQLIDSKTTNQKSHINNLFRPPYGQITFKQARALRKLDYQIIMWDVLAFDWKDTISDEKCLQNVVANAKNGSIIVFHDSVKASKRLQYALPKVLDYFTEREYEFKRIPE
ncbi:polysaccharide deacetylase family protein [Subsaxibacter sp. CAU 1640]|uniref:polysaccharide deacetylase family protein n=1 Tax=Subsaxibacter sp. CAU 1640 TaxID=2933271 RepID=UPI0020049B17|nr:polysaccharide deacetylase family protein [Subsaxibacter sp. CAU 1640]MCK7589776.1 polysaccharide deacetylase family protein [Subsaxibacter sp. CAU 1640]